VIIRVFRARIHPGKEGEFERFVRETGIPTVQAQAGCSQVAWGRSRWTDPPGVRRRDALGPGRRA
jgi:hypothetical protein